jgi:thiamine monophosphate synthase
VTGGVNPSSIPSLSKAGASRFVVVRHLTEADAPVRAAGELRRAIDELHAS